MDFTPLIPCGKAQSVACDTYIATVCLPSKIIIRSMVSLSIKRVIDIDSPVNLQAAQLQWTISQMDRHHRLLVADTKTVLAYDIEHADWSLNISEGLGGVRHVEWSASGGEILIWAEFQLKMTVWSVLAATGTILPNPKLLSKSFHSRPGRSQAALLQRTSQDIIAIIDTSTTEWQMQKSFTIATSDAQGIRWSPDGNWLAVWDNASDYRVLIYSPDGRLVRSYSAYEVGLGIKTVAWSPTTEYLAIGSYDDKVRLLNTSSFSPCMELSHLPTIKSQRTAVWRQVQSGQSSRYDAADQAISPPFFKSIGSDVLVRHGVSSILFSPNGYFLATRCDSMPTTVWIWSLREFCAVAILVNTNPVKHMQWMPNEAGELVFTCQGASISENNALYSWNIDWSSPRIISVPRDGFEVKWFNIVEQASADSQEECGILIGSGDAFTIGYTVRDLEAADDSQMTAMSVLHEEGESSLQVEQAERDEADNLTGPLIMHDDSTISRTSSML